MTMLERLAHIACVELGYNYFTLYETKQEWINDRGARHDINAPRKPDVREAVRAILVAIRDPDEAIVNAILLAAVDAVWKEGETVGEKIANQWRAGIDSILAQKD